MIAQAIEGPVTTAVAASFLQEHPNAQIVLDEAAAAELTRFKSPWLLGPVAWDEALVRKAVIWLARKLDKAILKLTDEDYNEAGLQDLLASQRPGLQHQPGRLPRAAGDDHRLAGRQARRQEAPRRHPPRHRHDLSQARADLLAASRRRRDLDGRHADPAGRPGARGARRLPDLGQHRRLRPRRDPLRRFRRRFNRLFGLGADAGRPDRSGTSRSSSRNKKPGQVDSPEVQQIKTLIRRGEARAAGRDCGVPVENLHFLDMPFYETGKVRKKPLGEEDIRIVAELLEKIRPHQIYAAGDLSDPHGTHRVCLAAIFAGRASGSRTQAWFKDCEVWLYRGAWQEWEPERIEMAVPAQPAGAAQQAQRDLQAPVAEGPGHVPRPRRARVLAAGRGPQPRHRPALRQARPGRVRGHRGVRALVSRCGMIWLGSAAAWSRVTIERDGHES